MFQKIHFKTDGNNIVEGFVLGTFSQEHQLRQSGKKHWLLRQRRTTTMWIDKVLVFIPWKHKMKECKIIRKESITDTLNEAPSEWITMDHFTSSYVEEAPYFDQISIQNFVGYDWVLEENHFIANVWMDKVRVATEILYRHLPELMDESFDEEDLPRYV